MTQVRKGPVSLRVMRTVVLGPNADVEALIERRRSLGQDRFDEVWNGDYHMGPWRTGPHAFVDAEMVGLLGPLAKVAGLYVTTGFNLGAGPNNFRVPDGGCHRERPCGTWVPTAAVVWEILSPDDETYAKFDFYAAHGVEEIIVADPNTRTVRCFRLMPSSSPSGSYTESEWSDLLGIGAAHLAAEIDWH